MLEQIITFIPAHEAQIILVISSVFSFLSLVLAKWPKLAKLCGTFAVIDFVRVLRVILSVAKFVKSFIDEYRRNGPMPPLSAMILVLLGVSGCAGTFEEAKLAGSAARKAAPPVASSSPQRCQSLSERQYWFTGAGVASAAIATAAGTITIPVESKTVDTVLIVTTVAGGVGAASFGWFGANAGADYVREGCGQ